MREGREPEPCVRVCACNTQTRGSISNKSVIAIKSGGSSIRSTWLGTKRILASFPLSFSSLSELEGAKCSAELARGPAGRSPRNDTLINVFFYLLSQGLAWVCKHPPPLPKAPRLPLGTLAFAHAGWSPARSYIAR